MSCFDKLREGSTGWPAKVLFFLIAASFVIAGVGSYLIPDRNLDPAKVNDVKIPEHELENQVRREKAMLERQFGKQFFEKQMAVDPQFNNKFKASILEKLINDEALAQHIKKVGIDIPANLDSAMSALPFFAVGFMVFRHTDMLKPNPSDRYLPLMIIGAFAVVLFISPNVSFLKNRFYGYSWLTAYPIGTLGVFGVIWLSKLLKKLPIISYYGRYSIIILVTHGTVIHFFAAILNRFGISMMTQLWLNLLLTMSSYMLIIPFMRKFMPHVTAQKDVITIGK